MKTSGGWKLLVVALVGYSILVTRKLLFLTDAAYGLAHEARYSSVDDSRHTLDNTAWGSEAIGLINMGMILLGLLVIVVVIAEIAAAMKKKPAPPP